MNIPFKKRIEIGKANKKLRDQGCIPVVCYGPSQKTKHFYIPKKEFGKFLEQDSPVITCKDDLDGQDVVLQDVDRNPVSQEIRHADFLFVDKSRGIEREVQLEFISEAPVLKKGGFVEHIHSTVHVKALPQDIPSSVKVDLSSLEEIGQHLKVSDIPKIPNVEFITPQDEIIVSIVEQKEEVEEVVPEKEEVDFSKIEATSEKKQTDESKEEDSEKK